MATDKLLVGSKEALVPIGTILPMVDSDDEILTVKTILSC